MPIALGIDTGGTYTDAVLVDYETSRILASAKALTTKHDLSLGIHEAVSRVLAERPSNVHLVSLSTTLATNAIVEGHGAPICVLLIGYGGRLDERIDLAKELDTSQYVFIPGGHLANGEEYEPLELDVARAAILEYTSRVAAFAVSGYFGTRNPTHEMAVKRLVRELTGLPVTCGHELTHRLDAVRRATTVALNARLIPLICDLITAVERTMAEQGIRAPLMVVKGDGSLMQASMAQERPVETILSGPAASVVGAQHLVADKEAIIVDMGGTTTDIAVVRSGRPQLTSQGARVGRWRTMVEAIDVHTAGLGGDSRVWLDEAGALQIGPRRVVPICLLASQHPSVRDTLAAQLARPKVQMGDGEFLLLQRAPKEYDEATRSFEGELWEALRQGPVSLERVHEIVRYPFLHARYLEGLEGEGVLARAGLTPTDAAHVLGRYAAWDAEAAALAARLMARRLGLDAETLCREIIARTSELVASQVVTKLMHDQGINGYEDALDNGFVAQALRPQQGSLLDCRVSLRPTLVAIGAPVRTYFPTVSELLHSKLYIPEHTAVANALGAVAGSVVARVHVSIIPHEDEGRYRVHLADGVADFASLQEALAYAEEHGRALAIESARRSGAEEIHVQIERHDQRAPVANNWGDAIYLGSTLDITAAGRPRLARE